MQDGISSSAQVDFALVKATLAGDKESFKQLVERYQQKVYVLLLRIIRDSEEATDLTQDVFVKAYLSLADFKGDAAFYTWLYRVAHNLGLDYVRKRQRRATDHLEDCVGFEPVEAVGLSAKTSRPDEELERKEQSKVLMKMFSELSEEHRIAMTLREVDGLSYEEIAEITGVSKGTVMSRLFYARKKLQVALGEFDPTGGKGDGGKTVLVEDAEQQIIQAKAKQRKESKAVVEEVSVTGTSGLGEIIAKLSYLHMNRLSA